MKPRVHSARPGGPKIKGTGNPWTLLILLAGGSIHPLRGDWWGMTGQANLQTWVPRSLISCTQCPSSEGWCIITGPRGKCFWRIIVLLSVFKVRFRKKNKKQKNKEISKWRTVLTGRNGNEFKAKGQRATAGEYSVYLKAVNKRCQSV